MEKKVYITDFCEDLNYKSIILFIDDTVDLDELLIRLRKDNIGHMYRFDCVRDNRLFYVENCDLQNVSTTVNPHWNELLDLLDDEYSILQLKKDRDGYYIAVPDALTYLNE